MQGERRKLFGDVLDLHLESNGVLPEPAQVRIGGGPAVAVLLEAGDSAIIDHLAVLITPAAINDLIDGDLVDVARQHTIYETGGVAPGDQVLEQRSHINKRRRIADSVVFMLVMGFVNAYGIEARPLTEVEALAEWERSCVDRSSDGHLYSSLWLVSADYIGAHEPAARTRARYRKMHVDPAVVQTNPSCGI